MPAATRTFGHAKPHGIELHHYSPVKTTSRRILPQVRRLPLARTVGLLASASILAGTVGCGRQIEALHSVSPTPGVVSAASSAMVTPPQGATVAEREEAEAYEVLALAILDTVSHGAVEKHYTLSELPTFEPFLYNDLAKPLESLEKRLGEVESIGPELAENLIAMNRNSSAFTPANFPPQFPVHIFSVAEVEEMFRDGPDSGWKRFYQERKRGSCIVSASLPAFNKERTKAVMMIWQQRGPLDGEGGFVIAHRIGGSWRAFRELRAPSGVSQHGSPGERHDRVARN